MRRALWNEDKYKDEEGVYSKESRDSLVEDDEITPEEAGFMQGYSEA